MGENKTKHKVQRAIDRFMDPEVNYQVMLASSPAAAKLIIEELPGVRDMVELGPEAGKAALNLLQREDSPDDYRISAVALYILERHPSPEAKLALAGYIRSGRFRGINNQLAAEAFLKSAGIKASEGDYVSTALREAKKLDPQYTHKSKH